MLYIDCNPGYWSQVGSSQVIGQCVIATGYAAQFGAYCDCVRKCARSSEVDQTRAHADCSLADPALQTQTFTNMVNPTPPLVNLGTLANAYPPGVGPYIPVYDGVVFACSPGDFYDYYSMTAQSAPVYCEMSTCTSTMWFSEGCVMGMHFLRGHANRKNTHSMPDGRDTRRKHGRDHNYPGAEYTALFCRWHIGDNTVYGRLSCQLIVGGTVRYAGSANVHADDKHNGCVDRRQLCV
jgi:hypothetical protein